MKVDSRKAWKMDARTLIFFILWFFSVGFSASSSESSEMTIREISGIVKKGETFSQSMRENGVPRPCIDLVVSRLSSYVDFKKISGADYRIRIDPGGDCLYFFFQARPTEAYEIWKEDNGRYRVQLREVSLENRLARVEGEIHSSLTKALKDAGEGNALAHSLSEILSWKMDLSREMKKGDRFRLLVEKTYQGGEFLKYGWIQAVEYQRGKKILRAFRYKGEYFDENGESLGKGFLMVPLNYDRISSGFSRNRRHPIMGGGHPHLGIDYAAPRGTPVWAVAEGVVESCGWNDGFGKQVVLRHGGGYKSYYSHLSRYGPGLQRGKEVKQREVVGYVGSTGVSTGSHLDYRLARNGRFVNPMQQKFPAFLRLWEEEMSLFQARKEDLSQKLNNSDFSSLGNRPY